MYEERIQWVVRKEKRIFSLSYSDLSPDELETVVGMIKEVLKKEPCNKSILSLLDASNLHFSMKVMSIFSNSSPLFDQYFKAVAIVGVTGLVKVMYDGVAKFGKTTMKTFNNKEEALNWLTNL